MVKILIVDDSLFMRNRIANTLEENGYETVKASDGVAAIESYRQERPDVVLMDITMPRKDGLEALVEIRQIDPTAKVIMLTALDQPLAAGRAIRHGAKDFLTKPVRPRELLRALTKVLR